MEVALNRESIEVTVSRVTHHASKPGLLELERFLLNFVRARFRNHQFYIILADVTANGVANKNSAGCVLFYFMNKVCLKTVWCQ